ncbi:MAG: helix-turn-helix transcriptional regulator [Clostridia bacterium]|nr:helix-turn-helix transcriptional regulator [Clostridia bacterium]
MERNFPIILCELRKEKGLSQKEAAAKLGVSQALLSHYEKGIRECGQNFLIKVADFYGVTCDYLLGRTTAKTNTQDKLEMFIEDKMMRLTPSSETFIKAALLLIEYMQKNSSVDGIKFDKLMAIAIYKIILMQASAGNLPKNWAGRACIDGKVCCNSTYLTIAEFAAYNALKPKKNKSPLPDSPIPGPIKALVSTAEDFIVADCTEKTPPLPAKYIR